MKTTSIPIWLIITIMLVFCSCRNRIDKEERSSVLKTTSFIVNELPLGYLELKKAKVIISRNSGQFWDKRFLMSISVEDTSQVKINNQLQLLTKDSTVIEKENSINYFSNGNFKIILSYKQIDSDYKFIQNINGVLTIQSKNDDWKIVIENIFGEFKNIVPHAQQ